MLTSEIKQKIGNARNILVGKIPTPTGQVEQITLALIYKFMNDIDEEQIDFGGKSKFFSGEYQQYAWKHILDRSLSAYERVTLYGEGLEKMNLNPNLPQFFRNVFKGAFLPFRDPEVLTLFLKQIDEFKYGHNGDLGDAFEYLLQVMGTQGDAGQFLTPRHIINFIVNVVEPDINDRILDPACGTGGFLISAYKFIEKHKIIELGKTPGKLTIAERRKLTNNFVGYDITHDLVRLSLVNLYLHDFPDPKIHEYDTLTSLEKWDDDFECILMNPPFMTPKGGIRPHKRFSIQAKRSEVLFVDYVMEHLTPNGKAGIIVPEGIIFQSANAYKSLRKMLLDQNYLYAVASLPAGVFQPYSGVKTSILFMDKILAKKTDQILFVKIENDGFDLGAQRRPIDKNDLPTAEEVLGRWKECIRRVKSLEIHDEEKRFTHLVSKKIILKSLDLSLSGDRYKERRSLAKPRWRIVKLGEICETASGGTPLKSKIAYYKNGTIPWLKSGEVAQGIVSRCQENITEEGLQNSSAKIFPVDTVLIAMYGATAGQVGLLKLKAATNQAICGVFPNANIVPEFLYWVLKSQRENMVMLSDGGAQPNISQQIIRNLEIPLPPLEVQEEIVSQLDGYQKIIDGSKQIISSYKPEVKIDPNWEVISLGEVAEINPKYEKVGIPDPNVEVSFVPMADLKQKEMTFISRQMRKLGEVIKGFTHFQNGDVLLAKITPCFENGKSGIARDLVNGIGFGSTEFIVFRPVKDKTTSEWVYHFISNDNFLKIGKDNMTGSAGQQRITADFIKNYKIPLPPLETQKQIVARIEEEQQIMAANRKLIHIYEEKIKEVINGIWGEGVQNRYPIT